jgi:hypothetical protein
MGPLDWRLLRRPVTPAGNIVDVEKRLQFLEEQVEEGDVSIVPSEARYGLRSDDARKHGASNLGVA